MNIKQKVQVEKLKSKGYSFQKISDEMNISVGSIKSYFSRKDSRQNCNCCGAELTGKVKRYRRFCSDKCRMKWWHDNKDISSTTISRVCPICNRTFISYPSKKQTYCSKQCSGKARWVNAAQHNDVSDNV